MQIEFFKHSINHEEKEALLKVLDTPYIAMGKVVKELESKFSEYLKIKHSIAVSSCTDALYLSLRALNIDEGDEVITTPLTFVATSNAICATGAKPVFLDVDPLTGLIDIDEVEHRITKNTKAIIPVHLYGHMVDMDKLSNLASKHDLRIIEDCAHCIEGDFKGIKPGELSDTACFSFFATKNITSGEGGMISTNLDLLNEKLRMMRSHGQSTSADERYRKDIISWDMHILGLNHKMTDFQAAMLLPQLRRMDALWKKRKEIYQIYYDAFAANNIPMPIIRDGVKSGLHLFTIWTDKSKRTEILKQLRGKGIHCTMNYNPVHLLSYYQETYGYKLGDFPNAENIGLSTISLPFYPLLNSNQVHYVIENVCKILKEI